MKVLKSAWQRRKTHTRVAAVIFLASLFGASAIGQESDDADYEILAIRYATFPDMPTSTFIGTASPDETIDAAGVIWLIRDSQRTILLDSGFHRQSYLETYPVSDFISPDEAVQLAGVAPDAVTDIIVSHVHWDHMGGIDLFPEATIWIQEEEYRYYTTNAWQPDGDSRFSDADDVVELVRLNTLGRVKLINGDNVEILPGITVYTGGRHTYASQFIEVGGYVLASDNCYLYRNIEEQQPVAITFSDADKDSNLAAIRRMVELAGTADHVIPGHDPLQFERFPSDGRVAQIR